MKTLFAALLLLSAVPSFAAPPAGFSAAEKPLRQAVEDAEACFHFAGEFNGDGSARDREVARMQRRHCSKSSQALLRKAYRANPADARLHAAVLMLNSLSDAFLSKAEVERLCRTTKNELVCQ